MANHKITELTQDTAPTRTDLLYKIDAAGTTDRSVSFADLLKLAQAGDVAGLGSFALISSLAHSATTGIAADDHHAKSHAHNGADGSGTVAYSSLSGTPTIPSAATTVTDETSFGVAKAVGTATAFSREDHTHGSPTNPVSYASPSVALGTAAAAGSASTLVRSDATIAAFDSTVPTTSAVGDAAATGSIAFAARRDHIHGREFGDVRTIAADTTLAADNSWAPVDYFEVASNVGFELASGAVVEVLT